MFKPSMLAGNKMTKSPDSMKNPFAAMSGGMGKPKMGMDKPTKGGNVDKYRDEVEALDDQAKVDLIMQMGSEAYQPDEFKDILDDYKSNPVDDAEAPEEGVPDFGNS